MHTITTTVMRLQKQKSVNQPGIYQRYRENVPDVCTKLDLGTYYS